MVVVLAGRTHTLRHATRQASCKGREVRMLLTHIMDVVDREGNGLEVVSLCHQVARQLTPDTIEVIGQAA